MVACTCACVNGCAGESVKRMRMTSTLSVVVAFRLTFSGGSSGSAVIAIVSGSIAPSGNTRPETWTRMPRCRASGRTPSLSGVIASSRTVHFELESALAGLEVVDVIHAELAFDLPNLARARGLLRRSTELAHFADEQGRAVAATGHLDVAVVRKMLDTLALQLHVRAVFENKRAVPDRDARDTILDDQLLHLASEDLDLSRDRGSLRRRLEGIDVVRDDRLAGEQRDGENGSSERAKPASSHRRRSEERFIRASNDAGSCEHNYRTAHRGFRGHGHDSSKRGGLTPAPSSRREGHEARVGKRGTGDVAGVGRRGTLLVVSLTTMSVAVLPVSHNRRDYTDFRP